jgi:hypothetical protein
MKKERKEGLEMLSRPPAEKMAEIGKWGKHVECCRMLRDAGCARSLVCAYRFSAVLA